MVEHPHEDLQRQHSEVTQAQALLFELSAADFEFLYDEY